MFVWDGDRQVLDYAGNTAGGQTAGQVLHRYVYGNGLDEVLSIVDGSGNRATPVPDIEGSRVALIDGQTGTVTKGGYGTYGESADATGAFRYAGMRIDAETNGLYYDRARMYSATLGRFLQPDPIGYSGGRNLYAYVGNDPLNAIDPTGHWAHQVASGANDLLSTHPAADPAEFNAVANSFLIVGASGGETGLPGYVMEGAGIAEKVFAGARGLLGAAKAVEAAPTFTEGTFSISNWTGYPTSLPKPSGPFRLLEGTEYDTARATANQANRVMHQADPSLSGMQIHEIQPVKFGGDPVSPANKIPLTPAEHAPVTSWWNQLQRALEGSSP